MTQIIIKNFDNVTVEDYESYMKAGICEFWAITRIYTDDSTQLRQLASKYGYGVYSTSMLDVFEVIKRGATFEDRTRQMKNQNLSILLGAA